MKEEKMAINKYLLWDIFLYSLLKITALQKKMNYYKTLKLHRIY